MDGCRRGRGAVSTAPGALVRRGPAGCRPGEHAEFVLLLTGRWLGLGCRVGGRRAARTVPKARSRAGAKRPPERGGPGREAPRALLNK